MEGFAKSLGLSQEQSKSVHDLYTNNPSLRKQILSSLSKIPLEGQNTIVADIGKSLGNAFCLICLKYSGASEEDEPLVAANFLLRASKQRNPLPLLSEDNDLEFCSKTLAALSLFLPAMNKRSDRYGYPNPSYYRKAAQTILNTKTIAHKALANHHKGWENFLFEQLSLDKIKE